jgi:hypothetical protein
MKSTLVAKIAFVGAALALFQKMGWAKTPNKN